MLEHLARPEAPAPAVLEAVIASAPDGDGRVFVTVPDLDPDLRHGPCPVMPRGDTDPARGDRALVAFTATGDPWVLAWEPA